MRIICQIKMIELEKHSSKMKHIEIRFHLIKQLKKEETVNLIYCPTKVILVYLFLKPLPKPIFQLYRKNLGSCDSGTTEIQEELMDINHRSEINAFK